MTGMFAHRHNAGAVQRALRAKQGRDTLARFADYLAADLDIETASKCTGITRKHGVSLLRKMRLDLGWQAQ